MDSNAPNEGDSRVDSSLPAGGFFEICIKGHLSDKWSEWLEGMEVTLLDNGEMVLRGAIVDQAALMGLLSKLDRLNLTLLSVNPAAPSERPAGAEPRRRLDSYPVERPDPPTAAKDSRDG